MKKQTPVISYQISERNFKKSLVVKKNQTVNLVTESIYDKPHQQGEVEIRAVVMDNGVLNLKGFIKIKKNADGAEAFLRQKVLLVGINSRAEAIPELEIESNEVRASHAASVGRIDEEQMFYLQSRGLTQGEAEKEIIKAFLEGTNE